jgi:hypothetical protein
MSSPPIKSTITFSNEQRPTTGSSSIQSTRTVVESANTTSTEHSGKKTRILKNDIFFFHEIRSSIKWFGS